MKANRKFLKGDDEAVSPVIAVILMVAITVVLAATVYVWVSGFGAQSSNPAKSLSMTSDGPIDGLDTWDPAANTGAGGTGTDGTDDYFRKSFIVSSATSGMRYTDLSVTVDGAALTFEQSNCAPTTTADPATTTNNLWSVCTDAAKAQNTVVSAGDEIVIQYNDDLSGKTLRVLDANANSVMLTLTIG